MLLVGIVACGFIPMLWHGQEVGDEAAVAALLRARANEPALRFGTTHYNAVPCDNRQVFAVLRAHEDRHVLGLLHVSPHKRTVSLSLPVDMLNLDDERFQLRDLLSGSPWVEEGHTTWTRDELLNLCLTLDAYRAYCFAIEHAPIVAPPDNDTHDLDISDQVASKKAH